MNDFLNPKSMMTPGACGGIVMAVTNSLALGFGLPSAWTGLAISFLLGFIVFAAKEIKLVERLAYYVVNSLIIFTTAFGITAAGNQIDQKAELKDLFTPSQAYAGSPLKIMALEELKLLRYRGKGPLVIEEGNRKLLSNFIDIKRPGILKDIKITVDIDHPRFNQLKVELTTPQGKVIVLHDQQDFSKTNMVANYTVNSLNALEGLIGESIEGSWDLRVYDANNDIRAKLNYWQLNLTVESPRVNQNKSFFKVWKF